MDTLFQLSISGPDQPGMSPTETAYIGQFPECPADRLILNFKF